MKRAIVAFLVFAASTTVVAVAQDGSGRIDDADDDTGIVITIPVPLPAPTPASPTVPAPKVSDPGQQ